MALKNSENAWGFPAKLLHWAMAILMIGLALVGTYMVNFERDMFARFELTQWHKSFGFVVFTLWERLAREITHYGLYILMFLMPLSGWLMASASPLNDDGAYPIQIKNMVFNQFELPDPIAPGDEGLESIFHAIHTWSGYLLAVADASFRPNQTLILGCSAVFNTIGVDFGKIHSEGPFDHGYLFVP